MIIYLLFFLSGAAGLLYELLWVREFTLILGGTTYAITTVLAAFMGGLALGSALAGRRAARLASPLRAYGLLEIGIALSALLAQAGFVAAVPLYRFLYHRLGPDSFVLLQTVRFGVSALLLVLPTACMGATLPVLVEHGTRKSRRFGNVTAAFYGLNTLGAATGTALAGFYLIPHLGRPGALAAAVASNLLLGGLVLLLRTRLERAYEERAPRERVAPESPGEATTPGGGLLFRRLILLTAALSGFAAMTYQIGWTRLLMVQFGSSTYAFTSVLTVFIVGLGLGALAIALAAHRITRPRITLGVVQAFLGLSCLWILPSLAGVSTHVPVWLRVADGSGPRFLASQFRYVLSVLTFPTLVLGTTIPLVVVAITRLPREASRNTGAAYSVNTVGTILGSIVAGFFLLAGPPGIAGTLAIAIALSTLLGFVLLLATGEARVPIRILAVALFLPFFAFGIRAARERGIDRSALTAGAFLGRPGKPGELLYYRDGADATVSVHRNPSGSRTLRINGKPDASTGYADMPTQVAIAQIPLLLAPEPANVMILGLGGGVTMASATTHGRVKSIDVIELSDAVIEAGRAYFDSFTGGAFEDPRVRIVRNDGRNHLLLTPRRYDVIISEPSNPWLAGIASLFTREYFELARSRLAEGGIFCQWLQSYGMAPHDFSLIVRTLLGVFPRVTLWQPNYADFVLIGSDEAPRLPLDTLASRMLEPKVYRDLEAIGLQQPGRFLGACIVGDVPLRAWAGKGPINTDENGRLEFSAPLHMHETHSSRIAASLGRHRGGSFESWIAADTSRAGHRALLDLARRSRDAVFEIYAAYRKAPDRPALVRRTARLHALDPDDWRVDRVVRQSIASLEASLDDTRSPGLGETRALLARLGPSLPLPPAGPLTPFEEKRRRVPSWLDDAARALDEGRRIDARELLARAALYGGDSATTADRLERLHRAVESASE